MNAEQFRRAPPSSEQERRKLIDELVDTLPTGDIKEKEKALWREVEEKKSDDVEPRENERPYWSQVEGMTVL